MGYLVYTIGTIITGGQLALGAAIGGGIAVAVFVGILICLCRKADKTVKKSAGISLEK